MNRQFNLNTLDAMKGAVAIAVMGMLLAAAAPAFAAAEQAGTIHSASETQLVLRVGTEPVPFQVNGRTSVTLNGKAAEIGDLKAGDTATVDFSESDDGEKTATTIDAQRQDAPVQL